MFCETNQPSGDWECSCANTPSIWGFIMMSGTSWEMLGDWWSSTGPKSLGTASWGAEKQMWVPVYKKADVCIILHVFNKLM